MATVYEKAVLADSPSVYYRLGDASAPAVPDSGAGGVNATQAGTVTFAQPGAFSGDSNTSVSFPGTATNFLQTASTPGSAYDLGDGAFTLECWFKNGATPAATQDLFGKQGTGCYVVRMDATGHLILNASGVGNCFVTTAAFTDTNWHHLVITRVAATQPHIYVDNVDQAGTYTARTFADSTNQFDIGRSGTANYFNGRIQDLALYKSALSSTRVGVHYNAGLNSVNGTVAMTAKKASILVNAWPATVSGTVAIHGKKPTLLAIQITRGTVAIHGKKPTISALPKLVGNVVITTKKMMIVAVPTTTGTAAVTARKGTIFASQKIVGTVGMTAKKPSIESYRRSLVTVRLNGAWANSLIWCRVGGVWVPAIPKVMIDGNWYTINFDEHGLIRNHVNMTVKKPSIAASGNLTLHGTVDVTMRRPVIQAIQHVSTSGLVVVQARKSSVQVRGKPAANTMLLGVNNYGGTTYASYSSVIPNCTTTRFYNQGSDGPNGIPSSWPSAPIPSGATHFVVSIRPTDIAGFIAGTYDAATKAWLRKIPAGHYICAYHEANLAANIFQTTIGGTPTQFKQIHTKLKALADAVKAESPSNPKVNVGIILGSANINTDNSPWVPGGMDWYGMDGYGGSNSILPAERYGPNMSAIQSVAGADATMAIIENNDKTAPTPDRWNLWFTDAFQIAVDNNMAIFMTWWGPTAQYPNAEIFNTSGSYVPTLQSLYSSI
jgi:hypothetical protein